MQHFIILGTSTNCGKTYVTGLLAKFFYEQGIKVITQKWVQTGAKSFSPDVKKHLKIAGIPFSEIKKYKDLVNPYCFKFPASPHLAAKMENKKINPSKIIKAYQKLAAEFDLVLVEGAGGVLVPLTENVLLIDLVKKLNLPVLLVIDNKLGAINETLLSIEALQKRKINILGLVFNQRKKNVPQQILGDNIKTISQLYSNIPWWQSHQGMKSITQDIVETFHKLLKL